MTDYSFDKLGLPTECWAYIDERFGGRLLRFGGFGQADHYPGNMPYVRKDIVGNLRKELGEYKGFIQEIKNLNIDNEQLQKLLEKAND
jgi:hypothetical protein